MTTAPQVGWSFLRTRRWIGYFALLIVFSIACVWLGNWQFERRAEARAEIARIDNNYDAAPMTLSDAVPSFTDFDEDARKWQPVELRGQYVGEEYLARNRPGVNGVGSNLLQAFELDNGTVVFIDRGWVPVSGTDVVPEGLPAAPEGETTVLARLRASEPEIPGRTSVGRFVPSINGTELAQVAGLEEDVYTGAYGQLIEEHPAAETGVLAVRPERDEGPHLSYALQWYVFILIATIGLAYGARQEFRSFNAEGESVRREDERRAERKRKRGPSDADEEDALLGS
ncbi:SURF1 family protein [Leucobacter sp. UT-8R-CII-1-4]|uniref:SURF1 family cytochrome oxidase biogenesis protein n=1 Tax=Leucobacter sp. UT-8R-CII-1-4 TaxID=3040075 RepID=UPI0024A8DD2C|nr:SURF1 family protein [Leucobacter sp. UT-8R-CII-1-4]MDI6024387.1 SURF1 family protein [Leucobacter sp. UT-8R-CII-1-4]